jgi:hypothetical protein
MLVVVEEVGDVVDAYDFYPYGLQMPERSYKPAPAFAAGTFE